MSTAFSRSMRSLKADHFRAPLLWLIVVAILLTGWTVWLFKAQVTLYAISDTARLEVERAIYPIEALFSGRVVRTTLALGREVEAGELLIELDTDVQKLELEQEQAQQTALGPQITAIRTGIDAEERARSEEQSAGQFALEEMRAKFREADTAANFAQKEYESKLELHKAALIAELELLRSKADAQKLRAAAESVRLAITRHERERQARESERKARIEALKREENLLRGQTTSAGVAINRLKRQIERHQIIAPIGGTIGELADLRVGGVVSEGAKLGAIVPRGGLRIVAYFRPSVALGRIRPRQRARLRLEGFPWAQYGAISAEVTNVANEVRDERVRIELKPDPQSRVPLQHGLPGTVEVMIDKVSPAALALRIAGQHLAQRSTELSSERSLATRRAEQR